MGILGAPMGPPSEMSNATILTMVKIFMGFFEILDKPKRNNAATTPAIRQARITAKSFNGVPLGKAIVSLTLPAAFDMKKISVLTIAAIAPAIKPVFSNSLILIFKIVTQK